MILKQASEVSQVESILRNPEIFELISEDGHDLDSFKVPFDGHQRYMLISEEDKEMGVWCLYPYNQSTLKIHCNILKQYRGRSKEAGFLIVDWFVKECPEQYQKLTAEIPILYPNVYHYTKKFGFKDEGISRKSIMKNGMLIDQWLLGLTREEAESYIGGSDGFC